MSDEFDLSEYRRRMDGAVSSLKTEYSGIRTGRANPALLDNIKVSAYGSEMPLNHRLDQRSRAAYVDGKRLGQDSRRGRGAGHSRIFPGTEPCCGWTNTPYSTAAFDRRATS